MAHDVTCSKCLVGEVRLLNTLGQALGRSLCAHHPLPPSSLTVMWGRCQDFPHSQMREPRLGDECHLPMVAHLGV